NNTPGVAPWVTPQQNDSPVAMPRPLPEVVKPPVAPAQQNVPAEPVRPPAATKPPEQVKPPEQPAKPVETKVPEKQDPPAKQNESNQPVKPFDYKTFAPSGDVYNPAGPPGLGESAPGETFNWEKDGKGGWDIDWRQLSEKSTDTQGYTTYHYKGEIDDSTWYLACLDGDTNFTAEETLNPQGQLYKRVMTYDGSLTYKVKTDNGPIELKDVHKITTTFNETTKNYDTEIECSTGAIYKAEVDATGKVVKFIEQQTKPASEAPGLPQANVGNFNNSGEIFHVARPIGIGGAVPGWAGGDNGILDWRETQVAKESNGNVTYKYKGEVEDSNPWLLNLNGDTNFEGQEVLDANNNLVSSYIKYDSSKDMKFIGVGGQPFQ
ncbi:MAG: hypothetical protein JST89_26650, partial [Cyanobacteria bacterium SZAS-4]|nr:hypothetical protein [Cyanobacteria bacterium SZAS-4]